MAQKTKESGGRMELPEPKPITKLAMWFSKGGVMVYEKQGEKGDITVIGYKLDEILPSDNVSMFVGGGNRLLSTVRNNPHLANADQISEYAHKKGLDGYWTRQEVQLECIRVQLGFAGPDKVYTLDKESTDSKGIKAAKVLQDLGVKKSQIIFKPDEFNPIVIA